MYNLPNPTETLVRAIPLNFYAMLTIGMVFFTAITGKTFGPLKKVDAEARIAENTELHDPVGRARFMVVPLLCLVGGIVGFMALTGHGNILAGSGSTSVLWATLLALAVLYLLLRGHGVFRHKELVNKSFEGMSELLPLVTTVLLAMSLGSAMKALGTGAFVAGMVGPALPVYLICPFIFIAGALMSFTTGTSWGTFAIMMPLAMPLGIEVGLPPELVLSAVLGGGVFGDHCSPISDTTIVASLASGCDLLDHTKTQLPYALACAAGAIGLYLVAGLVVI
jgi:Na+/H+ antiporter NhaC